MFFDKILNIYAEREKEKERERDLKKKAPFFNNCGICFTIGKKAISVTQSKFVPKPFLQKLWTYLKKFPVVKTGSNWSCFSNFFAQ